MQLFAQDRDRLLARLRRKIRKRFEVPAEVLEDIIQLHGYRIESSSYLPSSMLGCCHFDDRLVLIPESLAIRLRHPQSAPQVVRSVLAHELGHIRLHARRARAGEREEFWEDEADHYAQVFLVPWLAPTDGPSRGAAFDAPYLAVPEKPVELCAAPGQLFSSVGGLHGARPGEV